MNPWPRAGKINGWLIVSLVVVATILCHQVFRQKYDRELHEAVLRHMQEVFPDAKVHVGFVSYGSHGTIVASNVRMAQKNAKPSQLVFDAQRVEIRGKLELTDWLQDRLSVAQVDIFGAEITLWPEDAERWSLQAIVPRPNQKRTPPKIRLHDLFVLLRASPESDSPSIAFHHISGEIAPCAPSVNHAEDRFVNHPANFLDTAGSAPTANPSLSARLVGQSTGTIDRFEISALINPTDKTWRATGNLKGLLFSAGLLERLPPQFTRHASQLKGLECQATADFDLTSVADRPIEFKVKGKMTAGRLRDARLPFPLENIRSDFVCKNSQIQLRNMKAESGDGAVIELNSDIGGLALNSPMTIVAQARHVSLDQRLYHTLPPKLQEQWDRLQLSGLASGDITLFFDGHKWTPRLNVMCENVSLTPWLFPYPLTAVRGLVQFHDNRVESQQFVGNCGGQEIAGNFSLQQIDKEWFGHLQCKVHGSVAIDETLISALTPQDQVTTGAEQFIRELHPSGSVTLNQAYFLREAPGDEWHRTIDASIYSGSIKYDGFRYPIDSIRGRLYGQDDQWWLDQFEGRNDSGRIKCSGNWLSNATGNIPFDLRFEAYSVPTEEELKLALPSEAQFVWDELRPAGSIDRVSVRINRSEPSSAVRTEVRVSEDSSTNVSSNRSLRVRPKTFPYALTDVDCEIDYRLGQVTIQNASGVNGSSRLSLKGICQPTSDGRWRANVEWLPQTRLIVESELLKALPQSIRESLVRVDFRGPISILGKSEILFADQAEAALDTSWDCQVAVEDGQLGDGENIGASGYCLDAGP